MNPSVLTPGSIGPVPRGRRHLPLTPRQLMQLRAAVGSEVVEEARRAYGRRVQLGGCAACSARVALCGVGLPESMADRMLRGGEEVLSVEISAASGRVDHRRTA